MPSRLILPLLGAWLLAQPAIDHAQVITTPLPGWTVPSGDFEVTADRQAVPVEAYRDRAIASLSSASRVQLAIRVKAPIARFSIHPLSFGVKAAVSGDTLNLALSPAQFAPQPAYLIIKINELRNLVVLLDPTETPGSGPRRSVSDVSQPPYRADGSGNHLATAAIQSAIDHASQAGGGIVLVPAGLYRVQTLQLKSGVTLNLAAGAVIQGSNRLADYREFGLGKSGSGKGLPAVIEAQDFHDIAICGQGWIDANQGEIYDLKGIRHPVVSAGPNRRGCIRVSDGTGFQLTGVMVRDAGGWSVYTRRVRGVRISRVKLMGPMWSRDDGIDLGAADATVDQCLVYTGDDNFCTKASESGFPVHDVRFSNSIGYTNSAGVKVGMQVVSAQSEIHFENIVIIHAGRGLVIEHRGNDRAGQAIKDIFFDHIRVEEVAGQGGTSRNPIEIDARLPGTISNVFFRQVTIGNFGPHPSLIHGHDAGDPVTNVTFDDLTIGGKPIASLSGGDFVTENATGIRFQAAASR